MPALLPALLLPAIIAMTPHDATALLPAEAPWILAVDSYYLCHRYRYAGSGIPPARAPDPHEFQADKFLLVAPLWSEDGYYRAFIGAYRVGELPLPAEARVYRVLVPDRVEIVEGITRLRGGHAIRSTGSSALPSTLGSRFRRVRGAR